MRRPSTEWVLDNCQVVTRDTNGKARKVHVKGGEDREYDVIIRRKDGKLSVECREDLGKLGDRPCRALVGGKVCYHCRAALTLAAWDKGKWLRFYRRKFDGLGARFFCHAVPLYLFGKNEPAEYVVSFDIKAD